MFASRKAHSHNAGLMTSGTAPNPAKAKKWLMFALRWGVALAGIAWVVANLTLHDKVILLDPVTQLPMPATVLEPVDDRADTFTIEHPQTGEMQVVSAADLVTGPEPGRSTVSLKADAGGGTRKILALDPVSRFDDDPRVARVLVENVAGDGGQWVTPDQVVGGYAEVEVPVLKYETGLIHMVKTAEPSRLALAVGIFPAALIITGLRWNLLLRLLGIDISVGRTMVLNMVGAFYNTFIPGTTGGDVLKAYYAARNTPHRTRAVLSVIIDRGIGLMALIIMGGICAALQPQIPQTRMVAIGAAVIVGCVTLGAIVFYVPLLRRLTGLSTVIRILPLQAKVQKAVTGLEMLGRRPLLMLLALVMTFPVHATVVLSAMFAGMAFDLPIDWTYYWVVVPTVVLVGSIPISPQGAGVMELFAFLLLRPQGVNVGEVLALTMSIRLVQIVWNLLSGILVFRGGYTPKANEVNLDDDIAYPTSVAVGK